MSYYMYFEECNFGIPKEKFGDVLEAIKQANNGNPCGYMDKDCDQNDLACVLDSWGWLVTIDYDTGDVVDIIFDAEKLVDDDKLFKAIAPYVDAGSYIEMVGEDFVRWRWSFKNGECHKILPTLVWSEL